MYDKSYSASSVDEAASGQSNVDLLFNATANKSEWKPRQPPEVLGELMESRYMLPLSLPSDPRLLSAVSRRRPDREDSSYPNDSDRSSLDGVAASVSRIRSSHCRVLNWVTKSKRLRHCGPDMLDCIDGSSGLGRWVRQVDSEMNDEDATEGVKSRRASMSGASSDESESHPNHVHLTSLARVASSRSRQGRASGS